MKDMNEIFDANLFTIPKELKNDIIYCQISLRHYIKVHQTWNLHIQINPKDEIAKNCLTGLENEIHAINREQHMVLTKLRTFLNAYYNEFVDEDASFDTIKEYGDERVTKILYHSYNYVNSMINNSRKPFKPYAVTARKTAQELYETFPLMLKYERRVHSPNNGKSSAKPHDRASAAQSTNKSPAKDQISTSRMNLLNALNKAKTLQGTLPSKKEKSPTSSNSPSPTLPASRSRRKTPPATNAKSTATSESAAMKKCPADEEEEEDVSEIQAKQIIQNQELFLRLFGLYTHEKTLEMRSRRRERRRRNVTSTEKIDFHYGRIDYYDPKIQAKKKTSIMYSPPATRALKKKRVDSFGGSTGGNVMKSKMCKVCRTTGNEKLNKCIQCTLFFHVKCHRNIFTTQAQRARENFCPECYRQQQRLSASQTSQIRGIQRRDLLKAKNKVLIKRKEKLRQRHVVVLNKLRERMDAKDTLLNEERSLHKQMRSLVNAISKVECVKTC